MKEVETKPTYQKPAVKVLDESEMLAAFQVTSAISGWWV